MSEIGADDTKPGLGNVLNPNTEERVVHEGVMELQKPTEVFDIEIVREWLSAVAYPNLLDRLPQAVSEDKIQESIDDYLGWVRENVERIEPARVSVWCHATSQKGMEGLLAVGKLRSAKRVLLEGGSVGHGGGGKVRECLWRHKIRPNTKFSDLVPEVQNMVLSEVDDDVAGTMASFDVTYCMPSVQRNYRTSRQADERRNQYGLVSSLNYLKDEYGGLYLPYSKRAVEDVRKANAMIDMKTWRSLLYPFSGGVNSIELQVIQDDNKGTEIPLSDFLILVPEERIEELRGNVDESLGHNFFGVSEKFNSIDEVVGWLTSTPEGRHLFKQTIGVDPIEGVLRPIERSLVNSCHGWLNNDISDIESKLDGYRRMADKGIFQRAEKRLEALKSLRAEMERIFGLEEEGTKTG